MDLVLDDNKFLDEVVHGRVYNLVSRHKCFEVVRVEDIDVGGEVVFGLNELQLGLESGILLSEAAELLLLGLVNLLGLVDFEREVVGDLGLLLDLGLELGNDLGGLGVSYLVFFVLDVSLEHLLVKIELLIEQVVVLLLLLVELDGQLVVVLLGSLLLRDQLLHLDVLIPLELGLETLDGQVFPRESLLFELLVLLLRHFPCFSQLVLLVTQVVGDVLQLLHLDLLHLQIDTRVENLIAQLRLLS